MHKNTFCDSRLSLGILSLLLFLTLWPSPLPAQTAGSAALTGTVTDPTGAVISNATVTATNTGNGQVRNDNDGGERRLQNQFVAARVL